MNNKLKVWKYFFQQKAQEIGNFFDPRKININIANNWFEHNFWSYLFRIIVVVGVIVFAFIALCLFFAVLGYINYGLSLLFNYNYLLCLTETNDNKWFSIIPATGIIVFLLIIALAGIGYVIYKVVEWIKDNWERANERVMMEEKRDPWNDKKKVPKTWVNQMSAKCNKGTINTKKKRKK